MMIRFDPGQSPEALQGAVDVFGNSSPAGSEQRQSRGWRFGLTRKPPQGLTKHLCLAAAALPRNPRQGPLELRREIHARLSPKRRQRFPV